MDNLSAHPALLRLRAELDAAREGIGVLDGLEDVRRERVVAELRTAVPDTASRAARAAGADAVVAELSRFDRTQTPDRAVGGTSQIWDDIVRTAVQAACAAR